MERIAIIGADSQERMMLSNTFAYLIGYDVVRQTAYSSQAIKYGLSRDIKNCNWQELFVYALSSFSERMAAEQQFNAFISNGGVYNELAYMKAARGEVKNKRENDQEQLMITGLDKVVTEYAGREYTCIIHISRIIDEDDDSLAQKTDNCLTEMIKKSKAKQYYISKDTILVEAIEQIIADLSLHTIISPKTALEKAQKDMLVTKLDILNQKKNSDLN